jgi:hypothetical protein
MKFGLEPQPDPWLSHMLCCAVCCLLYSIQLTHLISQDIQNSLCLKRCHLQQANTCTHASSTTPCVIFYALPPACMHPVFWCRNARFHKPVQFLTFLHTVRATYCDNESVSDMPVMMSDRSQDHTHVAAVLELCHGKAAW